MLMAILLSLLLCPHNLSGAEKDCTSCAVGLTCQDLCDCHSPAANHPVEASHSHEFHNNPSQGINLDVTPVYFICMTLSLDAPKGAFDARKTWPRISRQSFAVRHLSSIILRV